ncbi:MAG TPA: Clp protease N-terminal domain-containing protein, partial [Solirubrobacteraceae bacterium]|nr:Clp protease N-terminal domain-containing protein [Solirubrobacteraceae bacterium]
MFERFSERARQVVVLGQDEARSLNHGYIGTEHILLALAGENEGVAARILLAFDADPEKIRTEVIQRLSGPDGRLSPTLARRPWPIPRELVFQREVTTRRRGRAAGTRRGRS